MSAIAIFFNSRQRLKASEIKDAVRDGLAGFLLALAVGWLASFLCKQVKGLDPLVGAVVLGLAVSLLLNLWDSLYFRMLPGILLAQAVLVPIGIVLYGKNLNIKLLTHASPLVSLQLAAITLATFVLMYWLGKWFGLSAKMRYLLGFGSAICGASAIAVASPIVECDPDETATALVDNTVAVLLSWGLIATWILPMLVPHQYGALCGALLHQTGFVKMALASQPKDVLALGMAIKSLRIACLLVAIPTVSYLIRRRLYVPWYMVLFLIVGFIFSYVPMTKNFADGVTSVYEVCFCAALASIGMNANLLRVFKNMFVPLVLVMLVFGIDLALWMCTRGFIHY